METPKVGLFTPPFLQPNAPYAATPFLAGVLKARAIPFLQADLSLETLLRLFSKKGLDRLFEAVASATQPAREVTARLENRARYLETIDEVILFLQGRNAPLARRIIARDFLPEGPRFHRVEDALPDLGLTDGAMHLAALYLDDLHDFAVATVLPGFGFSRYRERLASAAPSYDPIEAALHEAQDLVESLLGESIHELDLKGMRLACITVPFPGNLMGALHTARHLKHRCPGIRVALGGGWVNTELRSLTDGRLFDLVDYVCLDDGAAPLLALMEHLEGNREATRLVRTFFREGKVVRFSSGPDETNRAPRSSTPCYEGLPLDRYFTVSESVNPVLRLWSERGYLKLRAAEGCYHKRCTFCDTSLPYIADFSPMEVGALLSQARELVAATGWRGVHFVDEAMPPALMQRFSRQAKEALPGLAWWGNVRFDKGFTPAVCRDMKDGGCVAVTGGLEGVLDPVLLRMKKGATQAAMFRTLAAFRDAGILAHAYLIYAFPGATVAETVDALEVLRQLFSHELLQNAYWHRFALTVHSPVFAQASAFGLTQVGAPTDGFARNEARYREPGIDAVDALAEGLRRAAWNFALGAGLDEDVRSWFEFPVPKPKISRRCVEKILKGEG